MRACRGQARRAPPARGRPGGCGFSRVRGGGGVFAPGDGDYQRGGGGGSRASLGGGGGGGGGQQSGLGWRVVVFLWEAGVLINDVFRVRQACGGVAAGRSGGRGRRGAGGGVLGHGGCGWAAGSPARGGEIRRGGGGDGCWSSWARWRGAGDGRG